ncbi:hypothetical protein DTO027B5_4370 [Paecilomyces variotii]|nr:hypothetical protein DTO169C6_1499 [Paecilomyces variotii]KAJ9284185.1 hypothetical protein DTO021C3_8240 [Paecilomyces variotii]KAJ9329330.1 hypothetical protein DTO027B3_730 [Paecilomyces variotii]KAJ9333801.1 hypothetical protein DTO027B5_4370 [Paecilomyces variotii]
MIRPAASFLCRLRDHIRADGAKRVCSSNRLENIRLSLNWSSVISANCARVSLEQASGTDTATSALFTLYLSLQSRINYTY